MKIFTATDWTEAYLEHSSFKWNKLSTNSPWDFEYVLDIMDNNRVSQMKIFALRVQEPDGAVITFPICGQNWNLKHIECKKAFQYS